MEDGRVMDDCGRPKDQDQDQDWHRKSKIRIVKRLRSERCSFGNSLRSSERNASAGHELVDVEVDVGVEWAE